MRIPTQFLLFHSQGHPEDTWNEFKTALGLFLIMLFSESMLHWPLHSEISIWNIIVIFSAVKHGTFWPSQSSYSVL